MSGRIELAGVEKVDSLDQKQFSENFYKPLKLKKDKVFSICFSSKEYIF